MKHETRQKCTWQKWMWHKAKTHETKMYTVWGRNAYDTNAPLEGYEPPYPPPAMGKVVLLLFFNKNCFGIK